MIQNILKDRPAKLFIIITAFFVANALIAECIGGKIFSLEKLFGLAPSDLLCLGKSTCRLTLPVAYFFGRLNL
jgi:hypothetical protein